jgi:outer membrane protein assembly factor BamB
MRAVTHAHVRRNVYTLHNKHAHAHIHAHTGRNGTTEFGPCVPGSAYTGQAISSPAIGADGTVYVGEDTNTALTALDGATGAVKWRYSVGGQVLSSPAVGKDGTVYFGAWVRVLHT